MLPENFQRDLQLESGTDRLAFLMMEIDGRGKVV
jgi:hypothetical protein